MAEKEFIAGAVVGGIAGYFLSGMMKVSPKSDISEYQKKVVLVCPTPEGDVTLVPRAIYNFDMKDWKYGTTFLYTTPQGDVNAVVEISCYYEDGRYDVEIGRLCGGELKIFIEDTPAKTLAATPCEVIAYGYLCHVFG